MNTTRPPPTPRHVLGCMTGTSIDAIDTALVRIEGRGLAISATFLDAESLPLGALAPRLRAVANQAALTANDLAALAHDFSAAHALTLQALLARHPHLTPDLICIHGQTVFHKPPLTWQLFNPWPVVAALGVPVVFDLRGLDVALGGQGAPITPLADWVFFRSHRPRAIVNLGGFCNITLLPPRPADSEPDESFIHRIRGFDVCVCNQLLDALARAVLNAEFDHEGSAASRGTPHPGSTRDLADRLARQRAHHRSLGTGDEALPTPRTLAWLDTWRSRLGPHDLAASACAAIGQTIAASLDPSAEIILAGGGVHNRALCASIASVAGRPVRLTDALNLPATSREAAAMAVLGALCQDAVPITRPEVTGRSASARTLVAGCWVGGGGVGE